MGLIQSVDNLKTPSLPKEKGFFVPPAKSLLFLGSISCGPVLQAYPALREHFSQFLSLIIKKNLGNK